MRLLQRLDPPGSMSAPLAAPGDRRLAQQSGVDIVRGHRPRCLGSVAALVIARRESPDESAVSASSSLRVVGPTITASPLRGGTGPSAFCGADEVLSAQRDPREPRLDGVHWCKDRVPRGEQDEVGLEIRERRWGHQLPELR